MIRRLLRYLDVEDWKKGVALVILYAYGYQLCAWPMLSWATTLFTAFTGYNLPVPPIVPWEHLMTGTTTLAAIGGIETWRNKVHSAEAGAGGGAAAK